MDNPFFKNNGPFKFGDILKELSLENDEKYQDHEIILYHSGSADKWQISEVGKENEWEDEEEIYITIS